MKKGIFCQATFLFREPNLKYTVSLLNQEFDSNSSSKKIVFVIGASIQELVSLWVYARRIGRNEYFFLGINNNLDQVNSADKFLRNFRVGSWHTQWERSGGSIESDFERGILRKALTLSDYEEHMLNQDVHNHVKLLHMDAFDLIEPVISFDAVICNNVLVHFNYEQRLQLISIVERQLKQGGIFVRDNCDIGYLPELDGHNVNNEIEDLINQQFDGFNRVINEQNLNIYQKQLC